MTQTNYPYLGQAIPVFDTCPLHQRVSILSDENIKHLTHIPIDINPTTQEGLIYIPNKIIYSLVYTNDGIPYSNIDEEAYLQVISSDGGDILSYLPNDVTVDNELTNLTDFLGNPVSNKLSIGTINFNSHINWGLIFYHQDSVALPGSLQISIENQGAGPLEDGHESNTLLVTLLFYIYNLSTGKLE